VSDPVEAVGIAVAVEVEEASGARRHFPIKEEDEIRVEVVVEIMMEVEETNGPEIGNHHPDAVGAEEEVAVAAEVAVAGAVIIMILKTMVPSFLL